MISNEWNPKLFIEKMLTLFMKQISGKSRVQNASKTRSNCVCGYSAKYPHGLTFQQISTSVKIYLNLSRLTMIRQTSSLTWSSKGSTLAASIRLPTYPKVGIKPTVVPTIPHMILKRIHIGCIYLTAYVPQGWDQAYRSSKNNPYKDLLNLYTRFPLPATLKPQGWII